MRPNKISPRVRVRLREILVSYKLQEIRTLFGSEGFVPGVVRETVTGDRRTLVEEFYARIDWSSTEQAERFLRVCESVLVMLPPDSQSSIEFRNLLTIEGLLTPGSDRLRLPVAGLDLTGLDLEDDAAVHLHVERIRAAAATSPEEAIGASKDLIESACKYVLEAMGVVVDPGWDAPQLVARTRDALGLDPSKLAPTARGHEAVKRTLGGLSGVANGVIELRNQYGTGHGRPRRVSGLQARHGMLAANAAYAYVVFILSTLEERQRTLGQQR
jgi:abortive infection Abi-like protein